MLPKKRVAFFTENLYGGGVERILQTVLRYFNYDKFDVTLFSNRREAIDYSLFPSFLKYHYIFDSIVDSGNYLDTFLKKIRNKIKLAVYYSTSPRFYYRLFIRRRYDVGIAFIEGYATRILSGAPSSMKKIAWVHTDLINNPWTRVAFKNSVEEREVYLAFDKIVCVSENVKQVMLKSYFSSGRELIIHNPIDRAKILDLAYYPLPEEYEKKNQIRIVTIGSLIPIKGYKRLISVFQDLCGCFTGLELIIIGQGVLKEELVQQVREAYLDGSVRFTGFLTNPYPILRSADIYICSSFAEGYNTAITEALILGRPIVSTDCSGVREQLGNSEYGIVVNNDTMALSQGLSSLVKDSGLRQHYALKASERGKMFKVENSILEIESLINSV